MYESGFRWPSEFRAFVRWCGSALGQLFGGCIMLGLGINYLASGKFARDPWPLSVFTISVLCFFGPAMLVNAYRIRRRQQ